MRKNLNELSITKALEGLKSKQFSSVELVKACLEQIGKHNKTINTFITVTDEEILLKYAEKADHQRRNGNDLPLLGIPIAFKDLFSTKGIRTTAASKVLNDYIPPYDATVVRKIKKAGALIIGKTNCDAWAHGSSGENSDYGPTRNPWNTEYVPGGSSSGSAAAVATNMCFGATGTDTGGSIRLPASFCNIVGLKPTYGRVSRYGIVAMASSLDSIGHFTKTVEDSALLLSITAGHDEFDATAPLREVPDYKENINKTISGCKIGIPKEYLSEGVNEDVKRLTEQAVKVLERQGCLLEEISLPHTEYANACYYIIQPSEVSSNLARYDGIRYGSARQDFGDEAKRRIMLGTFTLSAGYYDAYYKKAMQVRTLIKRDFDEAFKKVDAIITPVSPTPPWKLGEKVDDPLKMYLSDIFTVTANLAGIPGVSVPIGFVNPSTDSGQALPVGMQILGPQFSEELLFQIGHAYEQATEWHKQKPAL